MERTAVARAVARTGWREARLEESREERATARTLRFHVADWPGHLPGQHLDLRLTAEDGYAAQRSYSPSAPADGNFVEVSVQLVADGEVSPYLVEDFQPGDSLEVLGPVGGWFVWRPDQTEPLLLIGGGSGVAPLWAIWQARAAAAAAAPTKLMHSVRTPHDVCFAPDILSVAGATVLYTRQAAHGSIRPPQRIHADDLAAYGLATGQHPTCYGCGPTTFVEFVIEMLIDAGHHASRVRAERFGASAVCAGCGQAAQVAALLVFGAPMGLVARCPSCDHVMLSYTELPAGRTVQMRGMAALRLPAS